jgi:hypothetical protein
VASEQLVCAGRAPGSWFVGLHRGRRIQQWLHDAPHLLHAVFPGKEAGIALQSITEKPFVGLRRFPELIGEDQRQIYGPRRLSAWLLRLHEVWSICRGSRRYKDPKVFFFARSPVMPKIIRMSAAVLTSAAMGILWSAWGFVASP